MWKKTNFKSLLINKRSSDHDYLPTKKTFVLNFWNIMRPIVFKKII